MELVRHRLFRVFCGVTILINYAAQALYKNYMNPSSVAIEICMQQGQNCLHRLNLINYKVTF